MDLAVTSEVFGAKSLREILVNAARKRIVSPLALSADMGVDAELAQEALEKLAELNLIVPSSRGGSVPLYRITADGSQLAEEIERHKRS
jgi:ribosomal protein S25